MTRVLVSALRVLASASLVLAAVPLVLVLVLVTTLPHSAHAQDAGVAVAPDVDAQARALFDEGLRLLDGQLYEGAARAFEQSLALRESPAARYDLALSYRGMRKPRAAIEALLRVLADPAGAPQAMITDAAVVLGEQERLVAHVTLRTHGPEPVEVMVDGEPIAPVEAQVVDLDPGRHVFAAHAEGRAPVTEERDFANGARETVAIELESVEDRRGHLDVRVTPPVAEIAVDGRLRTHGSYAGDLDAGLHVLRISAPGYLLAAPRVTLVAGQRSTLDLSLERADRGADPWVFVGVGVACAVTAALVVALAVALTSPGFAPYDTGSTGVVVEALH